MENCEGYQLREETAHYQAFFKAENDDIRPENTCCATLKVNNQGLILARPRSSTPLLKVSGT